MTSMCSEPPFVTKTYPRSKKCTQTPLVRVNRDVDYDDGLRDADRRFRCGLNVGSRPERDRKKLPARQYDRAAAIDGLKRWDDCECMDNG